MYLLRHRIKLVLFIGFVILAAILLVYHGILWNPLKKLPESAYKNLPFGILRRVDPDGVNTTHRTATKRRLPHCIIIGVRKGGTRALLNYIKMHPSVKSAGRELHFFDKNYSAGVEYYRSLFPYSKPNEVVIEKTPKYFVTPEVPERVHRMNSSIKLILIVREPVERAISDFVQIHRFEVINGKLTKKFEDFAIDKKTGKVNLLWHAIRDSIYDKYITEWLKYFPRKQILILDSKNLTENPLPVLKKVESFLNLEPRITADMFYFNKTKGFYCRNAPYGGCLGKHKGFTHPDVDPKVIERLRTFFRPHNHVLYKLLDHDFNWP